MCRQYSSARQISRFRVASWAAAGVLFVLLHFPACARTLEVGPGKAFLLPSEAAVAARNGDTILIAPGVYRRDVATWRASNLTIRGAGGPVRLESAGKTAGKKAIWVVAGDNVLIENIHFSGAVVPDHNGAGIRQEGTNLTVRHCAFRNNEMGIMAGRNPRGAFGIFRQHRRL